MSTSVRAGASRYKDAVLCPDVQVSLLWRSHLFRAFITPVNPPVYTVRVRHCAVSRKHWTRVGACVCRRRETGNIILRCTCQRSRNSGCCTTVSWLRIDACVNRWLTCSKYYLFSAPTHTDLLNTSFLAENSPSVILNGFKPAWPQKNNWECESRKNISPSFLRVK